MQAPLARAADVVENDVITKPAAILNLGVIEAVDHRQPIALFVCQAGPDQPTRSGPDSRLPVFNDIAGNWRVFHHICEIGFVHFRHATTRVSRGEIAP